MKETLPAKREDAAMFDGNNGEDSSQTALSTAFTADKQENDVVLSDIESIHHIYVINEFERQVLSRISSKGFKGIHLSKYYIDNDEKKKIDEEIAKACINITNKGYILNWKNNPKKKSKGQNEKKKERDEQTANTGKAEIECDLYLQLTQIDGEEISVRYLLKDLTDNFFLINDNEDKNVDLKNEKWIWMEIAETPESLKAKMMQLERAYRYFKEHDDSFIPECFVICLNGERGKFDTAAKHIKKLFDDGKLDAWGILSQGIPCFVVYTPYRNVYGALHDLRKDMDDKFNNMDDRFKDMDDKFKGMDSKFKGMDSKIDDVQLMLAFATLSMATLSVVGFAYISHLIGKK